MSTYLKFRRPMPLKQLLSSVEGAGWEISSDGKRLEKGTCVHIEKKGNKVIGLTRYGLNDCESLTYLADDK